MISYIEQYYTEFRNEELRFVSNSGKVEYLTTLKYIEKYLKSGAKILEVGAGTGQYSLYLSRRGFDVTAIELVEKNIERFKSKLMPNDQIQIIKENALDLSQFEKDSFDIILILGPMYHLFTQADMLRALTEAKRILNPQGVMMVDYIMNEPTIVQWGLPNQAKNLKSVKTMEMLTEDFHCLSQEKDIFQMVRIKEIDELNRLAQLEREKIIATDLFTHYLDSTIDAYDEETFQLYLDYHFSVCEREELIGVSNHVLDIINKQ